jgi:hypothetical protein
MSLRKPTQLTPELLAAKRRNARLSTGPRTPPGKQHSKLNALKHGRYAAPENHRQTMLALGEDPEEFDHLKQELMTAYGPGDALWEKQIDDLAQLYWRRDRLQRAETGLLRRALLEVEEWQHRRQREMAGATFDASQSQAIDTDMTEPDDPGVRLRMLLSFLGVIRAQVKQRIFKARQASEIKTLYHDEVGWRQARLLSLLDLFNEWFGPGADQRDPELEEIHRKQFGPRESAGEPQYQELLRLLDEEIASVKEEFQYAEKKNEEKAAIERDAALAPVGEEWQTMLRQEGALDRSIDRKVRILLALRRQCATADLPSMAPEGHDGTNIADMDEVLAAEIPCQHSQTGATAENTKMKERSLNVDENKGPAWRSREGSLNVHENKGSYPSMTSTSLKTGRLTTAGQRRHGRFKTKSLSCPPRPPLRPSALHDTKPSSESMAQLASRLRAQR